MARVARGDRAAFELLYDRHARAAFSLATYLLRDAGLAEDVVQEAFLAVWQKPAGFVPGRGTFPGWLRSIVRHRAADRIRQQTATARRDRLLEGISGEPVSLDPAAIVLSEIETRRLRSLIGGLPSEQLQVLLLAYFEDRSQSDIAALLGLPLGTVKSRARLAHDRLRREIATEAWAA